MRITRAVVPSLFTVLNMFCGFLAIVNASKGDVLQASWLIILAAGFDALDGVMARITKSSSQFGVEIDSLSDVVSFGAAPAFLVYQVHLHTLDDFGLLLSSLPMVFAGLKHRIWKREVAMDVSESLLRKAGVLCYTIDEP